MACGLAGAALGAALAWPSAALAAAIVIDPFDYPDSVAAQAAWKSQAGSLPVEMADSGDWGNERVMKLPCNFTVQASRSYWDRSVALDLSAQREVTLNVFVSDPGPISTLTLYFHSTNGWYGLGLSVQRGWQTLHYSIRDFRVEGTPAGWNQIDAIRLSPWKETAQDTYLAVRELGASTPGILIVQDTQAADTVSASTTAERISDWLGRFEVSREVITGADVETGYLAGSKMAILPYNEVLTDAQLTELENYVASGGKLMVFYLLNPRVQALLGIARTGWKQGSFATFHFSDDTISGLPASVLQASWNITLAAPTSSLNARVIATWDDDTGTPTGDAAWLASDNGVFMSHVLLDGDIETKQLMLLVLVAHYVPEVWPDAAAAAIDNVGRIGEYLSYDEALADIRARAALTTRQAQVEASLAQADAQRPQAQADAASGLYLEAVLGALDARRSLLEAYYVSQSPLVPEWRAVWEHRGTGPYPVDWNKAVGVLADNGFNAVVSNMLSGGLAHYDSALLPHSDAFTTYGDQITALLAAAQGRGLQVHVWKVNWNLGSAPASFVDAMRAAGRTQVSDTGESIDWLCPSDPDNLALERDAMLEIVRNYPVDGIHFDYIRYPNNHYCYCNACRTRFEAQTGNLVASWPADVRAGGALEPAFLDWRRAQITNLVKAVHDGAKAINPNIKISAAVFSSYDYARDGVGQDWVDWINQGLVDFLCPMDYTNDHDRFRNYVSAQTGYAAGRIPVYPGIGALSSSSSLGPDGVIAQILITRAAATGGFIVFNFDTTLATEHLPALAKGITASVPPDPGSDPGDSPDPGTDPGDQSQDPAAVEPDPGTAHPAKGIGCNCSSGAPVEELALVVALYLAGRRRRRPLIFGRD